MLFIMSPWRLTIKTAVNAIYGLPRGVILHEYKVVCIRRAALPQAGGFIMFRFASFLLRGLENRVVTRIFQFKRQKETGDRGTGSGFS
jgi:hypothetical protein